MTNPYYNGGSFPSTGSPATSASMRAELTSISSGFDKLPTLSGNGGKLIAVNTGATGLEAATSLSVLSVVDFGFTVVDNADATKKIAFEVSGVTAGTTRTITAPDADLTIVGVNTAQTLTNKTLTTPVLSATVSGTTAGQLGYSSGEVSFGDGTSQFVVGYKNIPQNSQSVAYTLLLTDAGKHILHPVTDANARTFTIPANSSVAYPIGTAITFVNMSSSIVTIAITTDTLYLATAGTTGSRSLAQYGLATALKINTTQWIINGSNLS